MLACPAIILSIARPTVAGDKSRLHSSTVARLNPQATIGPELSLATKPVRSLHQRQQAGGPNRTDAGDLAQQFGGFVFPGAPLGPQIS